MGLLNTFKQVLERSERRVRSVVQDAQEGEHPIDQQPHDHHDPIDLQGWSVEEGAMLDLEGLEDCTETDPELGPSTGQEQRSRLTDDSKSLLVILTVMADENDHFEGGDLLREFNAAGLQLDRDGLFHAYSETGDAYPLFSVCNILTPGIFDQREIMQLKTRGVALFFEVPCEHSGKKAFNAMVGTAHQLSLGLGGRVLDGERRPLSACALQRLQDQVHECEYRRELEQRKSSLKD